jgi:RNA polymerase sigma-70 factor (ECF subfamily)
MTMKSDHELVVQAIAGDAAAFAAILERHYDLIYRLAYRMLGNQQDAEDITQDVCIALPKKLNSFSGRSKLTTWLYQVTVNTCRDFQRRCISSQKAYEDYSLIYKIRNDTQAQKKRDAAHAYQMINTLNNDLRETALLVVAEGLNHAEAAEVLDIKESTVSWRMLKVRENLSALVQRGAGEL